MSKHMMYIKKFFAQENQTNNEASILKQYVEIICLPN